MRLKEGGFVRAISTTGFANRDYSRLRYQNHPLRNTRTASPSNIPSFVVYDSFENGKFVKRTAWLSNTGTDFYQNGIVKYFNEEGLEFSKDELEAPRVLYNLIKNKIIIDRCDIVKKATHRLQISEEKASHLVSKLFEEAKGLKTKIMLI